MEDELTPEQLHKAARAMGRKGGRACLKRHGVEHFRAAGRKGGRAAADKRTPEQTVEMGQLGGAVMARKHADDNFFAEIGRKGGAANAAKGIEYFREIGRKGGRAKKRRFDEG